MSWASNVLDGIYGREKYSFSCFSFASAAPQGGLCVPRDLAVVCQAVRNIPLATL